MGQYDFSYCISENFINNAVQLFIQGKRKDLGESIGRISYDYEDLGLAYYKGLKGDVWNKNAIDLTIEGSKHDIELLRNNRVIVKKILSKAIRSSVSGFLINNIYYLENESADITLPLEQGDTFEVLSRDIHDSLAKGEPILALDRLYTYTVRYIRNLCNKYEIDIEDDSHNLYPLHSLMGMLVKHYNSYGIIKSRFTEAALKSSISLFERFGEVRNQQSFAHDNTVLNNTEATYVVEIVSATLKLLSELEKDGNTTFFF